VQLEKEAKVKQGEICIEHPYDSKTFYLKTGTSHLTVVNSSNSPIPDWKSGTTVRILNLANNDGVYIKGDYSETFRLS